MIQEQITVQPIIAAGRFDLRPLRKSDSGLMSLYLGDARVATGTRTVPHPLPPGAAEAMAAATSIMAFSAAEAGRAAQRRTTRTARMRAITSRRSTPAGRPP